MAIYSNVPEACVLLLSQSTQGVLGVLHGSTHDLQNLICNREKESAKHGYELYGVAAMLRDESGWYKVHI